MEDHHSPATPGIPKTWAFNRKWGINAWNKWARTANQGRQLGESPIPTVNKLRFVSPKELDIYLKDFVNNMKRYDGEVFKRNSAHNIYRGLAAHLVNNLKCPHLNFLDQDNDSFVEFREAASKTTMIPRKRKITKDRADQHNHENRLWDKRFLDMDCPKSLLRAVYAFNCSVFGITTIKAHEILLANQFVIGSDKDGDFVAFYGNVQESEDLSETNDPIVSVEEIKLYDTGENDSVYNIFKKYLNGIISYGKFYILPRLFNDKGRTKKKMMRFSTTPMNYSQIHELHEDMITSQTYRKLFLLQDFDAQKKRFTIPSQIFDLTHTSPTSVDSETDFITQGMEHCAKGLMNEENEEVVILETRQDVTREVTSQKSPSRGQVQHPLWAEVSNYDAASFSSLGREPVLLQSTPNMIPCTPNLMINAPNLVTGTPNMMTGTQNVMTDTNTTVGMQTPDPLGIPAVRPLTIRISPETSQFENNLPEDRQTLLLKPNDDLSQDEPLSDGGRLSSASYQTEQIILECDDETSSSHSSQQSFSQQHETTAITSETHRDSFNVLSYPYQSRMKPMYQSTYGITPTYPDTTHRRSQTQVCHSRGADENRLNRTSSESEKQSSYESFSTVLPQIRMNLPPTSQQLNTTEYQHTPPLNQMDNASSVHPIHQLRSNAGSFYGSPPEQIFSSQHFTRTRPTTSLPNQTQDQYPYLRKRLSMGDLTNHGPPLNSENQPISSEDVSTLSRMKVITECHKELLNRQERGGIPPSSFSQRQQPRESQNVHQEQQKYGKKHFSEYDSQDFPIIQKLARQSQPKRSNQENQRTPENTEKGCQGRIDNGKGATFSGQSLIVPTQALQTTDASSFVPVTRMTEQNTSPSNSNQTLQDHQGSLPDLVSNRNGNDCQFNTTQTRLTEENNIKPGLNHTEANLLEDEREIIIIDSAEDKIPKEVNVSPSIVDKEIQTNHSARNSKSDSTSFDQDIGELLDFDPSLRKSFHKKCTDWWIQHKNNFEMNILKCQNMSPNSSKDNGKSENTVPENQQEISNQHNDELPKGNPTTGDIGGCEKRHISFSPSAADVCSNSILSSPNSGNFNNKHLTMNTCSANVLNNDFLEKQSAGSHEMKTSHSVGGHCVADDVKCMSAFYVC